MVDTGHRGIWNASAQIQIVRTTFSRMSPLSRRRWTCATSSSGAVIRGRKASAPDASIGITASSSGRMRSGTGPDSRTPTSAACGSDRVMTRRGPPAS